MHGVRETASGSGRSSLPLFGLGQASRSLIWCVTDLLIAYHFTVRIGLPGAVAGGILFASFALGAVLNLVVAAWIERSEQIRSSVLKWQAVAGISTVLSGALLFAPPPSAPMAKIAFVCLISMVFRISYATLDVCQNALTSLLPRSRAEIPRYVLTRTIVSSIARLVAAALVFCAIRAPDDDYADFAAVAVVALPVVLSVCGLYSVASRSTTEDHSTRVRVGGPHLPLRRLAAPVLAMVLEVGLLGLIGRLIPLFNGSVSGEADGALLVVALVCGTIIGPAIAHTCARRGVSGAVTTFGLSSCAAATGIALLAHQDATAAIILAILYGAALSGISNIIWERVALMVTDHAGLTGVRSDAMAFAVLTAAINVAIGVSNALLAVVLDGFDVRAPSSVTLIVIVLIIGGLGTSLALTASDTRRALSPAG